MSAPPQDDDNITTEEAREAEPIAEEMHSGALECNEHPISSTKHS